MKKTRNSRHKKHLSDFEMDDIVEKNSDIESETKKENLSGKGSTNNKILTEIQEKNPEHVNEKSTRKRTYDTEYNRNGCIQVVLISNTNIKSKSDTIELIPIKKRVRIPYTEEMSYEHKLIVVSYQSISQTTHNIFKIFLKYFVLFGIYY